MTEETVAPSATHRASKTVLGALLSVAVIVIGWAGWHWGITLPRERLAAASIADVPGLQKANARTIPDLGIDLIWIPPSPAVAEPFWLGRTEITQKQWTVLMETNPSQFKGEDLPIEHVDWTEAMEFCKKLTERERTAGRLPTDYEFALPNDAQWEHACRAGTTGDYPGDINLMAWYFVNSGSKTHPIATKQPNAWGLYDMLGNVAEWCLNGVSEYPPGAPPYLIDRSVRGGSWRVAASQSSSSFHIFYSSNDRQGFVGFRVALSPISVVQKASVPIRLTPRSR